jgi:hypothetical protein
MIEVLGIKLSYEALAFLGAFIASEVIGASSLKSNSVVQLLIGLLETVKPLRKEDDKIEEIRKILNG